ncbi:MAG TPA: helix-turn-helix domain-containing protein [Clostridiales bacterium]|nr:helix-turn-helix domain-containing protein [Clostridiales bacterium]
MILAEKIMTLRKRAGWSQEELAAQLGVSRQSVSKWEGAQSVPDMQKVVQMSRLFGVTTDYLLKEELGEPEPAQSEPDAPLRCVTMEQAADYLSLRRAAAPKLAAATLLCVLSPVALLLLAALSDRPGAALSENAAVGIGLCVLLVLVAAAVAVFITCAAQVKAYAFLESEPFETAYGVTGMVRERRAAAAPEHTRGKVVGTVLCILSAVPLFIAVCLNGPDLLYVGAVCLLLVLAGIGSAVFVSGGVYWAAMDRLLEEGDYARPRKRQNGVVGVVSSIYWLTVTAAYLLWTFGPWWDAQPQDTWILWAVAGVLYGAVMALVRGIRK